MRLVDATKMSLDIPYRWCIKDDEERIIGIFTEGCCGCDRDQFLIIETDVGLIGRSDINTYFWDSEDKEKILDWVKTRRRQLSD